MSTNSLKEAVKGALIKLGKDTTLRLVPELGSIDISTPSALANLLLDPNNVVFREHALLKVVKYCREVKGITTGHISGEHQREVEAILSMAELRHVSRHCSTGLVLTQHPNGISLAVIDGPSSGNCDDNPNYEYLPLIGLAIGHHEGPIKTALDDLFLSRINRGRSRNTICTRFLANMLNLWRDIISLWVGGESITEEGKKDSRMEMDISQTTVEENRTKGKKRARSPDVEEETLRAVKRGTPANRLGPRSSTSLSGSSGAASSTTHQNQATWPGAIRVLVEATPLLKPLPSSTGFDVTEQFYPKTFASHFGSGSSGVLCGWNHARRAKSFGSGVGHDQIIRASNIQPFRPLTPCSTGVILELSGTNDYKRPLTSVDAANNHFYTVMVQPALKQWLYCGEYRLIDQGTISWDAFSPQVQKKWIESTFFRRLHEGVQEILKAEVGAVISKISIERAFENGHISLRALVMQCVDYHEHIQKAIIAMNLETTGDKLIVEHVPDEEDEEDAYALW